MKDFGSVENQKWSVSQSRGQYVLKNIFLGNCLSVLAILPLTKSY
jgi:hypothetical protein